MKAEVATLYPTLDPMSIQHIMLPLDVATKQLQEVHNGAEQAIDYGGDLVHILRDTWRMGSSISDEASTQVRAAIGTVAAGKFEELGRKDRKSIERLFMPTELDFLSATEGVMGDPRQVLALRYLATTSAEATRLGTVRERVRRLGSPIINAGLFTVQQPIELGLLRPGILDEIGKASSGYFIGKIVSEHHVGLSHVTHKSPLQEYPEHIAYDPYLRTATKYWALGGLSGDGVYSRNFLLSSSFLQDIPEHQKERFIDAAEELEEVRRNNYWGNYERASKARFQSGQTSSDRTNDSYSTKESSANRSTRPEEDVQRKTVIGRVEDASCRKTLESTDIDLVQQAIELIKDMRLANPDITDRKIYLTCRSKLETSGTNDEATISMSQLVPILDLLLSGNVTKTARFPALF